MVTRHVRWWWLNKWLVRDLARNLFCATGLVLCARVTSAEWERWYTDQWWYTDQSANSWKWRSKQKSLKLTNFILVKVCKPIIHVYSYSVTCVCWSDLKLLPSCGVLLINLCAICANAINVLAVASLVGKAFLQETSSCVSLRCGNWHSTRHHDHNLLGSCVSYISLFLLNTHVSELVWISWWEYLQAE
jgi:hypothetical protein